MSEKIKNFFRRKKTDQKFKNAGPGHKLNATEPSKQPQLSEQLQNISLGSSQVSGSSRQAAAAAAIARHAMANDKSSKPYNRSANAIRIQAMNELCMEGETSNAGMKSEALPGAALKKQKQVQSYAVDSSSSDIVTSNLAVTDAYFRCPLISEEILPKSEWKERIESYLFDLYEKNQERPLTACLIIQSCNPKKKKEVNECINYLTFYLNNILHNLDNVENYRKIRIGNRNFQNIVAPIRGAIEFMLGVGFEKVINDEDGEEYLIYNNSDENNANLDSFRDALHTAEPIQIELDRNMQVLSSHQANQRTEIPDSFFKLSVQELRQEAQRRHDDIEKLTQLRTKEMREKDAKSTTNKYKYSVIRIRFPDAIFLQGTFNVYESVDSIIEFVRASLKDDSLQFSLKLPQSSFCLPSSYDSGVKQLSLLDAALVPTSILIFEPSAKTEAAASLSSEHTETFTSSVSSYLKEEVMLMASDIATAGLETPAARTQI